MPKNELNKAFERVIRIFKRKISITHKKLQFLVYLFFFAAKIINTSQAFLSHFYNVLALGRRFLY